jgi:hypothetical protein
MLDEVVGTERSFCKAGNGDSVSLLSPNMFNGEIALLGLMGNLSTL